MNIIRKKKHIYIILIMIIFACTFNGCNLYRNFEKEDGKIKIGLSMDSLVIERWQKDRDIFTAKAKELDAEVIVQNANNNTEEQIEQIKYLISQKVDVLVIIPHDSDALESVIKSAKKKGIKIIAYDRLIRNSNIDMYISFDNVKVGELMAQELVKKVPRGNYIIINGAKEDFNSFMINEGCKKVLSSHVENGEINIIEEIWADGWREQDAFNIIDKSLAENDKIDAIIAANDRLAEAAIKALSEQRLAGEVYVVGQDAELAGCQRVVEGLQIITVYKPINLIAQKAAEIAVKFALEEDVQVNNSIYNGSKMVDYLMEQPIVITKENMMDVIIKSGFHKKEDVYRNSED